MSNPRLAGEDTMQPDTNYCRACDLARHICPGCGTDVEHGEIACAACNVDLRFDRGCLFVSAMLSLFHGPTLVLDRDYDIEAETTACPCGGVR